MLEWLRPYLPNSSGAFSLVAKSKTSGDEPDMRAYWPIHLMQIVGGKRWSISFIWHKTAHPILTHKLHEQVLLDAQILSREEFAAKYYEGDYS